ncbi:nascent polypeptide-associated complex protein [archaeon]|nr:nascent polypeptide-associated complex protein [archaeon]|tara:strand:- start:15124 stop:15447 length:324 start_codon:yes stop_codon:yes gene_type:complete
MIPGINPKQMEKVMKQMGMKQEPLEAKEVIIKQEDKELIIRNPEIMKVNMMGQETLQITGQLEEKESINEEDISLIEKETNASREDAIKALKENDNEVASAIISLKE